MRKELTSLARGFRRRETDAEKKLWSRIRDRKFDGWKFKRQVPCGPYVLDFFCFDAALVIELDGGQHAEDRAEHDRQRTAYLEREGLRVLRFWNGEVLTNLDGVIETIHEALGQKPAPSPGALRAKKAKTARTRSRRPLPKGRGEAAANGKSDGKR